MCVKVAQLCPTLCDPVYCIVHGILQARTLEWVAVSSSRGSSQPRGQTQVSHIAGGFFTSWATRKALCRVVNLCVTYSWLSVSEVPPCTQFCINGSNHDSRFNQDQEVLFMYSLLGKNLHISGLLHSTPCCSRVKCNYKRTRGEAGRFIRKLLQWSRGEVMIDRWRQRWKEVASWEYLSGGGARRVRGRKRKWGIEILLDFCFKQLSRWWHYFDMGKAEREATLREETKI